MHASGVRADPQTFEHVDPERVGNSRDLLVSELAGRGERDSRRRPKPGWS